VKFFAGRRGPTAVERLRAASWRCASCGTEHEGMFDLAAGAPDYWTGPEEYEPNCNLRMEGDFLSEDFCIIAGEHFFVRCVFEIPVHGMADKFGFGVWSTLSRRNFEIYTEGFDDSAYADSGPWTGWFSNNLATFGESLEQPCWVHPQLDGQRPFIRLADEGHPLAVAQNEGISPERLMEIYAAYGHEPG
jgi:hypothetical protein